MKNLSTIHLIRQIFTVSYSLCCSKTVRYLMRPILSATRYILPKPKHAPQDCTSVIPSSLLSLMKQTVKGWKSVPMKSPAARWMTGIKSIRPVTVPKTTIAEYTLIYTTYELKSFQGPELCVRGLLLCTIYKAYSWWMIFVGSACLRKLQRRGTIHTVEKVWKMTTSCMSIGAV